MGNMEQGLMDSLKRMAFEGPIIYMHCVLKDQTPLIDHVTPNIQRILGYSPAQLLSGDITLLSMIHKEDRDIIRETLKKQIVAKSPFWESSMRISSGNGDVKSIKVYFYVEELECGETSILAYIFDQTDLRQEIEKNISLEHQRWATAIDSASEGVWDINPQTNDVFFSKQIMSMLGYQDFEFTNKYEEWSSRIHPEDVEEVISNSNRHVQNQTDSFESTYRLLHKDGTYRWILSRGKAVARDENGIATRVIGTHVDITEQKEMKLLLKKRNEELEHLVERTKELAVTDPLTSLYNRRKMMEEVKRAKEQFSVSRQPFSLAILDLDYFKQINDKYGHTFGDIALQTFANLLVQKIKSPNVIARWGGEEFILLFPNKNMQQTKRILSSLQACCNEELLKYRTESIMLTFSAGACEFSDSDIHDDIIKKADQALYLAKSLGRNQIVLYNEGLPVI